MSDIITRLLLKTNDFDANLEKSKGSVNRFQGDISNIAKSVGSSFVKVAGGIGLAVSASESFMKIIRSTQTTSDEFDNTLNACKGTVDIFFQSLSSGSFEAFNNGVLNTISNKTAAWYYYSAIANKGVGNNVQALEHARMASSMEPNNATYQQLVRTFESGGSWYTSRQSSYGGMPTIICSNPLLACCLANLCCNACCAGCGGGYTYR